MLLAGLGLVEATCLRATPAHLFIPISERNPNPTAWWSGFTSRSDKHGRSKEVSNLCPTPNSAELLLRMSGSAARTGGTHSGANIGRPSSNTCHSPTGPRIFFLFFYFYGSSTPSRLWGNVVTRTDIGAPWLLSFLGIADGNFSHFFYLFQAASPYFNFGHRIKPSHTICCRFKRYSGRIIHFQGGWKVVRNHTASVSSREPSILSGI